MTLTLACVAWLSGAIEEKSAGGCRGYIGEDGHCWWWWLHYKRRARARGGQEEGGQKRKEKKEAGVAPGAALWAAAAACGSASWGREGEGLVTAEIEIHKQSRRGWDGMPFFLFRLPMPIFIYSGSLFTQGSIRPDMAQRRFIIISLAHVLLLLNKLMVMV